MEHQEHQAEPNPDAVSSSTVHAPRILLAEDDDEMRALLVRALRKAGYEVIECGHGWDLIDRLRPFIIDEKSGQEPYDLVISDIRMPGISGMSILKGLNETKGAPPVILITAFGDEETHGDAEQFGAAALFDKPFDIGALMARVAEIVPL